MGLLTNVSAPYSAHLLLLSTLRIISTNPDSAWSHVRTLPLKVLTELLARYLGQVGKLAQEYAEVGGRTTPNLEDATEALRHVNVSVETLKDFVTSVSNVENMESMDGKARRAYETELERADRLREAGSFLSNLLPESTEPYARLVYQEVTDEELESLKRGPEMPDNVEELHSSKTIEAQEEDEDSSDDSSSEGDPISAYPTEVKPVVIRVESQTPRGEIVESEVEDEHWQPGTLPKHVYGFLPPFPGLEQVPREPHAKFHTTQLASTQTLVPTAPHAEAEASTTASAEAWREPIPFDKSEISKLHLAGILPTISPAHSRANSPEREIANSSLPAFYEAFDRLPGPEERITIPSTKKRRLAATLSQHALEIPDSLYGSIPVPSDRKAFHSAGWFPYRPPRGPDDPPGYYVYPDLHPFNGPYTQGATEPVPLSNGTDPAMLRLIAPLRPAYPLSHLSRALLNAEPTLAHRLLRIAPPGPLDNDGTTQSLTLEHVDAAVLASEEDEARYLAWGFQWRQMDFTDPQLPPSTVPEFDTSHLPSSTHSRSASVPLAQATSATPTGMGSKISLKLPRQPSIPV